MASSSSSGSSPSAPASSSTASSAAVIDNGKATENRLYQASLILEWQLYNELLGRHRQAATRLQDLTNEAAALREENALLRSANEDLKRRIVSRLLTATRSTNHSGSPLNPTPSPIGFHLPGDQRSVCEQLGDSSINTLQSSDLRRNTERSSLPKSISVRSTGYMKIDDSKKDNLMSSLNPSMENKIVTLNRTQRLQIQKEEEEVGLTSIEVDAYYQGMHKTELCNKWQETGACPYGDHCQFAHGVSELRPVLRHPRYKTEVCRMVQAGVRCPYGHRCHFRHALTRPHGS